MPSAHQRGPQPSLVRLAARPSGAAQTCGEPQAPPGAAREQPARRRAAGGLFRGPIGNRKPDGHRPREFGTVPLSSHYYYYYYYYCYYYSYYYYYP